MTRPTPEQLAEWRRLAEAASPAPWRHRDRLSDGTPHCDVLSDHGADDDGWFIVTGENPASSADGGYDMDPADARFIAASRTAVPALLDRVAELEASNERLREALRLIRSARLMPSGGFYTWCDGCAAARALGEDK